LPTECAPRQRPAAARPPTATAARTRRVEQPPLPHEVCPGACCSRLQHFSRPAVPPPMRASAKLARREKAAPLTAPRNRCRREEYMQFCTWDRRVYRRDTRLVVDGRCEIECMQPCGTFCSSIWRHRPFRRPPSTAGIPPAPPVVHRVPATSTAG